MRFPLLILILALAGCESPEQTAGLQADIKPGRFVVESHGAFKCNGPDRESKRAIYVITDTETGVRYLAVQGCGTSQLVTESDGKHNRTIER